MEELASEASRCLIWSMPEMFPLSSHANAALPLSVFLSLLLLFANQEACESQGSVIRR